MKFRVEITEPAERDIEQAFEWLWERAPDAALRWFREVRSSVMSLKEMPTRAPLAREHTAVAFELRQLVVGRYRVLFRVEEDVVQVLRVRHDARRDVDEGELG